MDKYKEQRIFAANIGELKRASGISYRELSKLVGLKHSALHHYLTCNRSMPIEVSVTLARHFGKSLDWAFTDWSET